MVGLSFEILQQYTSTDRSTVRVVYLHFALLVFVRNVRRRGGKFAGKFAVFLNIVIRDRSLKMVSRRKKS